MKKDKNFIWNFSSSAGHEFEEAVTEIIERYVSSKWGPKCFEQADMEMDQHEGTDCIVYKNYEPIRLDPTLNFTSKNRMKRMDKVIDIVIGQVYFGIRYGNGKVDFEEPVLVIGFDVEGVTKSNAWTIAQIVKDYIGQILDTGTTMYLEKVAA